MDEEAPPPPDIEAEGNNVNVPAAGELGLGDEQTRSTPTTLVQQHGLQAQA